MTTNLNYSHQVHAHDHLRAGFATPGTAPLVNSTHYTCMRHPNMVRDWPGECPECDTTLIPMHEAVARTMMELRSLYAVTKTLRLNRI